MSTPIGIHDLAVATGRYSLDLAELAEHGNVDVDKYYIGLGQEKQSIVAADEDIVTMAAAAARPVLDRNGTDGIRTIMLATETGIDQSKSAAVYVHGLLGMPADVRAVELKQACYSGTSALQFAAGIVARNPEERVLVITSDVAWYDLDSSGEATQGAAAVAMLISANPKVAVLDTVAGLHTSDVQDFWRPNYRSTPVVDGKLSIDTYLSALEHAWADYTARGGHGIGEFHGFCYHQPFSRMAYKAHARLLEINGIEASRERLDADLAQTTRYGRIIGNSYSAALYIALFGVLDQQEDLTGETIGMFSYGSGCVSEFFSLTVVPGYRDTLDLERDREAVFGREPIDYATYRGLREATLPTDGSRAELPASGTGPYRLAAIDGHSRIYEAIEKQP
ncbi:MAG: hydroxymethylglutaryl-CoA synthase [Gordonia sp. (in: high G+C Gram-positive bacteria)]|uniref:hydroxymethylglutaryl-CoA synthase n=1 Tax=Gordonia sp. (in: high G+C Gram-positive bacteria) TaxID=84139 RepID=UPI0039E2E8EA